MIFYNCMTNIFSGTIRIKSSNLRDLPIKAQVCSYLMAFVPILCIPIYAIYKLFVTPARNFDEVKSQDTIKINEQCLLFFSVCNKPSNQKKLHSNTSILSLTMTIERLCGCITY